MIDPLWKKEVERVREAEVDPAADAESVARDVLDGLETALATGRPEVGHATITVEQRDDGSWVLTASGQSNTGFHDEAETNEPRWRDIDGNGNGNTLSEAIEDLLDSVSEFLTEPDEHAFDFDPDEIDAMVARHEAGEE